MKNKIKTGIWIDNKQAIIVKLFNGKETVEKIISGIESRVRTKGEGKQFTRMGKQFFTIEKSKEEKLKNQLKKYFDKVIERLKDADSIMIAGPAEAKTGLQKEIAHSKILLSKFKSVEPADSMTDKQVLAFVKNYYEISHKENIK